MRQDSTHTMSATSDDMLNKATEEKAIDTETRNDERPDANDISEDIDPENEVTGPKLYLIHFAICLCTLIVGLDFNLIATAVPSITTEFSSIDDVGWYGASFMLAM